MTFLGRNDVMACLAMMAPRLVELRRVLGQTDSLYLHCEPTKPMVQAAAAGFYESQTWQQKYPKLQLRTVEELLAGHAVERPPTASIDETFKKASRAKAKGPEQGELL